MMLPNSQTRTKKQHFTIQNHNWYGKFAHIMRKDGHTKRCQIKELDINGAEVSLRVEFNELSSKTNTILRKKKAVSPLLLASTSVFWKLGAAVSSEDEDESKTVIPPPAEELLPHFKCAETFSLTAEDLRKLQWMINQVNNVLDISSS